MSDTPTYASLLARLFTGSPEEREAVLERLGRHPAQAHAVEQDVRDRLRDEHPRLRTIAAEAVLRVYHDRAAAVRALAGVLRRGDPAASHDTAGVLRRLGADAVPLVALMARHTPEAFRDQPVEFHRWAGAEAILAGPEGLSLWPELMGFACPDRDAAWMMGLADAAPRVAYDLGPTEPWLRGALGQADRRYAAGAALWRVTWRINRAWLDGFDPLAPSLAAVPGLLVLALEVLIEQLGRRSGLTGLVRDTLATLAGADPVAAEVMIRRLADLGMRGWGVLLPMLHPAQPADRFPAPAAARQEIYREALRRPAVLPLVHHHAHGVIAGAAAAGAFDDFIPPATLVLRRLGSAAGTAVPDLLALAARVPPTAPWVAPTLPAVAAGYPNTPAAIVRTLHQIRTSAYFGEEQLWAFQALCEVLAELAPDAGPKLAENTAVDARVAELVVQQPGWKDAAPEVRRRHARVLADLLAHPREEVRVRAADLLRHYRDQLPAVWPALVAALAGADEKVALAVLPHFRRLEPVADAVTADLVALFREKNPAYAARAVVALWRMGRMPAVSGELRQAVEADPETGWGWAVLRGVIDRISAAHGMLGELSAVFAASPAAVAERVQALVNPPESPEDIRLTACIPRPGDPTAPAAIDWKGIHGLVGSDPLGPFVYLALMLEYGSAGYSNQKIWLIKEIRGLTGMGLAESKRACEKVADLVPGPGAPAAARHEAVRGFFANRPEPPAEIERLVEHPLSWYRWAGLELADAWGLSAEQVKNLTEERVWDRSPRVRERALRMVRG